MNGVLQFTAAELGEELSYLDTLAEPFIAPESAHVLKGLISDLKGFSASKRNAFTLEIAADQPLTTRTSNGEFEPKGKSESRQVFARMSGIWELARVPQAKQKKGNRSDTVAFTGLSSLAVAVWPNVQAAPVEAVAHWKMELGDAKAPGCYFHTFANTTGEFPVPRHPSLFATPMAAIEFVLGELFQDSWDAAVGRSSYAQGQWRDLQKRRWKQLLAWMDAKTQGATSSPWMALKAAKPNPNPPKGAKPEPTLFLEV